MNKADKTNQLTPEKPDLKLGFIPLIDCCVLAVAKETGLFEKHGLEVELYKEASWANIRDKVCVGALDGAHMLAGMPIATTLGLGFTRKPMLTAFSMNLNGNAITVSNELYERLLVIDPDLVSDPKRSATALKQVIDENKVSGKALLNFAMVYPFSNHNYEIRYWMASAGINPDQDVHLRVIPPQYIVDNLKHGQIDGFCVGGPWNSAAVKEDAGKILLTGYEIWNNSPEKVFGVTRDWAEKYPDTHLALIKALLESAAWIDKAENRNEAAEILADKKYIGISKEIINLSMAGDFKYSANGKSISVPDFNVFHRYLANFPWRSHASWTITQMYRWGQLTESIDIRKTVESVYRPDIYREAAEQSGMSYPASNYKREGEHHDAWILKEKEQQFDMGADAYFDGQLFDSENILDYLSAFDVHSMKVDLEALKKLNKS
jgi:nitrate/nitrite transport system substrate-binding protein